MLTADVLNPDAHLREKVITKRNEDLPDRTVNIGRIPWTIVRSTQSDRRAEHAVVDGRPVQRGTRPSATERGP